MDTKKLIQVGAPVFVYFQEGADYENFTGRASFLRHVPEDELVMYGAHEPHCIVKLSPSDVGSVFPTSCVVAC